MPRIQAELEVGIGERGPDVAWLVPGGIPSRARVRQALVFIDGDDSAQLRWALSHYTDLTAKIIMVKGGPLEAMTRYQRRFYFDQGGFLTDRFGIHAVPAVVEQAGKIMRVSEIPVSLQRGG